MSKDFLVYLRKPANSDQKSLSDAYKRSRDLHSPYAFAPDNIDDYINQPNRYLVCHTITHDILGTFNISNIVRGWFQSAYLGYEVFVPFQQQGFMSQGMQLIIEEAFTTLNLHRLEANIQTDNIGSIRLVARAGFIKEGFSKKYLRIGGKEWKDHERWALVNEQWQDKNFI